MCLLPINFESHELQATTVRNIPSFIATIQGEPNVMSTHSVEVENCYVEILADIPQDFFVGLRECEEGKDVSLDQALEDEPPET